MKLIHIILGLGFLVLVGGFGYLASVEVPVKRKLVQETVPHDRLLNAQD